MLLIVGATLLVAALGFLFKVGLWVWIASHLNGGYQAPTPPEPSSSGLDGMKKTLGVLAATIGVITATVGLVKECTPDTDTTPLYLPQYEQPVSQPRPAYQPRPAPKQLAYSTTCCSSAGNCTMMNGVQVVGTQCFCFGTFGQTAVGTVCQ